MAGAGTVGGVFTAFVGVRLQRLGAAALPHLETVPFDARVIVFALLAMRRPRC